MKKTPKTEDTKTRILRIAAAVFYKHGYRATGVELIAKSAGIKKATLYHHFTDKDQLIKETLEQLSAESHAYLVKAWNKKGLTTITRLTVLFDELEAFFKRPDCCGCPFINAAGEYTDKKSIPHRICEAHFGFIAKNLEQFAREAGLMKPRVVAKRIVTVITGCYSSWFVAGMEDAARQAKYIAELIIQEHTPHD